MGPRRIFPVIVAIALFASTVAVAHAYGGGHGGGRGGGSHAAAPAHGTGTGTGHGAWSGHRPHHHRFFGGFVGFWGEPWLWPGYSYADPWYIENPWYGGATPIPGVYPPLPDSTSPDTGSAPPIPSGIYWCPGSKGYYPYVRACPSGWQRVGEAPVAGMPIAPPPEAATHSAAPPGAPMADPPAPLPPPPSSSDRADRP